MAALLLPGHRAARGERGVQGVQRIEEDNNSTMGRRCGRSPFPSNREEAIAVLGR